MKIYVYTWLIALVLSLEVYQVALCPSPFGFGVCAFIFCIFILHCILVLKSLP